MENIREKRKSTFDPGYRKYWFLANGRGNNLPQNKTSGYYVNGTEHYGYKKS